MKRLRIFGNISTKKAAEQAFKDMKSDNTLKYRDRSEFLRCERELRTFNKLSTT